MKKILSIILCLSMLVSSVAFAAPVSLAPIDVESAAEVPVVSAGTENEEADLSALPALAPVSVSPDNGASNVSIGDPAYKVTFDKEVNPEDVTLENLGVSSDVVNAVWYDEEAKTVYLFPSVKKLSPDAVISFPEIISNIPTSDGQNSLYFPAVKYTIGTSHGDDGENMFPYANSEYNWLSATANQVASLVKDEDGNNVIEIKSGSGGKQWLYFYFPAVFEANTEYKFSYKVKGVKIVPDAEISADDTIYDEPNFLYPDANGENHTGLGRVQITELGTWYAVSGKHTTNTPTSTANHKFAAYMEPPYENSGSYSLTHYIDDVEVYKKVKMTFEAGNNATLVGTAPAALSGYNGDTVTLPADTGAFQPKDSRWTVYGWTDGENTYNFGEVITVDGAKTFTPWLETTEENYKVTFSCDTSGVALPSSINVINGDTVDLTDADYTGLSKLGYWFDGWTVKGSDEIITSITPAEDTELVAKFSLADHWDLTNKTHYDNIAVGGESADISYDPALGAVLTPKKADNQIATVNVMIIDAADYSAAEIAFVKTAALGESANPAIFFSFPENRNGWSGSNRVSGKFDRYEGENNEFIVYKFDMASCAGWTGNVGYLRVDPYDAMTPWTIRSIRLIQNTAIESADVTGIDVPVIRNTPDTTAVIPANANYSVSAVTWTPAGTYFDQETEYTVNVTLKPASGYRFAADTTAVTVNGEKADIAINVDRTATVSYKFPATGSFAPVTVTIDDTVNTITEDAGTITLSAAVTPDNPEDTIDSTEVTWSVDNENIAKVEGNVLYALDNGTVTVTAASVYNPFKTDSFTVTISGQTLYTVTFNAGTKDASVTNIPEAINCRRELDLAGLSTPVRAGYQFMGWKTATYAEETVDTVFVEEDMTLYATWAEGMSWEFNTDGDFEGFPKMGSTSVNEVKDGCYTFTSATGDPNCGMYNTLSLDADKFKSIEIRMSSSDASYAQIFFVGTNAPSLNETNSVKMNTVANSDGEFSTYVFNMAANAGWGGTVKSLRFDFVNKANANVKIDYIRITNNVEEYVDVAGITAPVAMAEADTTAEALAAGKFTVTDVTWEQELIDGKYFYDNTVYTANITVAANTGVLISDTAAATVDGEEAEMTANGDGTYTIKYSYPATEDLADVEVKIDETKNAITVADGTIELSAKVVDAATGALIDNQNVVWSVGGADNCEVNGNILTAIYDGEVTVTASSEYDRTKTASYVVTITNQLPPFTVTFNAGTNAAVTNLPDAFKGKKTVDLAQFGAPERDSHLFLGWKLNPKDAETVSSINLNKDTNLYASWMYYGGGYEFTTGTIPFGLGGFSDASVDIAKGILTAKATVADTQINANVKYNAANKTGGILDARKVKRVEMRYATNAAGSMTPYLYFTSMDPDTGAYISGTWGENPDQYVATTTYASNSITGGDLTNFQTVVFDMSAKEAWTGIIDSLRIDPFDGKAGSTIAIDYIRFVSDVNEYVDITGITEPVAKATVDTDAVSADETMYTVKDVTWEPAPLYEQYHDGETEYTVNVTVASAGNKILSDGPFATINGKTAYVSKVNDDGSLVVSYKFPATDVIENKDVVEITLIDSENTTVRTIFVGDTFALDSSLVKASPKGYRWIGWAETDGDLSTVLDEIVTETGVNRTFYAQYEKITEFDFTNKYHTNISVLDAEAAKFENGALVVTANETGSTDISKQARLYTDKILINATDYAAVEVVFDAAIGDASFAKSGNQYLYFGTNGVYSSIAQTSVVSVSDDGRSAYKYTFDVVKSENWTGEITELMLAVNSSEQWAVRSIKFIPTKNVTVAIRGADKIERAGRYEEYSAIISAVDGSEISRTDISLEIVKVVDENGNPVAEADFSKYATVDAASARLYPLVNSTVTIRATSNYNRRAYDEMDVVITNQGEQYIVTYDLNANGVSGAAPAPAYAKGTFKPAECTATRSGYFFAGWSLDPDDAKTVDTVNVTEATTLYAIWGKGIGYEFNTNGNFEGFPKMGQVSEIDVKDGCYYFITSGGDPNGTMNGLSIDANEYKTIEIKISSDIASDVQIFFAGTNASISETNSKSVSYKACADGEFDVITFDMSDKAGWSGTIKTLRFDLARKSGVTAKIDYVRLPTSSRTVKFNGNGGGFVSGGTLQTEISVVASIGTYPVSNIPERSGYNFMGWSRVADGTGTLYSANSVKVADDVTFYAIWAPSADLADASAVTTADPADAASMTVTTTAEGLNITSTENVAPVIAIADSVTVDATNTTLLLKLDYNYSSMTDNTIKLQFNDASGALQTIDVKTDVASKMEEDYIAIDLSAYPEYNGTITNVAVVMPEGTITYLNVKDASLTSAYLAQTAIYNYYTAEDTSVKITTGTDESSDPKTYAPVTQPSATPGTEGGGSQLGGSVGSNNNNAAAGTGTGSTMKVPTGTGTGAGTGTGTGTTVTPAESTQTVENNFKFKNEFNANTFTDVKSGDWFYGDVEKSYKLGLMNGKGGSIFDPNGSVTVAEAITVAARIHAICVKKTIAAAKDGEAWYTPNVNYAIDAKIITKDQFADYNAKATRKQVAQIFANCAPSGWLAAINMFASIPDVDSKDAAFEAILSLYNSGIITGVDASYKFNPDADIKRSEMSAIINRVAIPESRIRVVTSVEKNEAPYLAGMNGDEVSLTGFFTGGSNKLASVADPANSSNKVYEVKAVKEGKVWSYLCIT